MRQRLVAFAAFVRRRSLNRRYWDDLSRKLRAVVLEVEPLLLPDEIQAITEFIDVGEPGLAFEMMCTQLYERDSAVSSETVARLREVGLMMQLEPDQWESLRVVD